MQILNVMSQNRYLSYLYIVLCPLDLTRKMISSTASLSVEFNGEPVSGP